MSSDFVQYYKAIKAEYGGRRAHLFALRHAMHLPYSQRWISFITKFYRRNGVETVNPNVIRTKIVRNYGSRRLRPAQRLARLVGHYQWVEARFASGAIGDMLAERTIDIATAQGKSGALYRFTLAQHWSFRSEGELTLFMTREGADSPLAMLTFSFGSVAGVDAAFVGGLQGPRGDDAKAAVVEATRDLHGWRPKGAVVDVFYSLLTPLGVGRIEAAARANHPFAGSKRAFLADNDAFWAELTLEHTPDGDFLLPLALPRRDIEDVTPKKRAEWRKRYALKGAVEQQISARMTALTRPVK